MTKQLFIYHADCFDGFTAAWLFSKAYEDVDFHPAYYGEPPPSAYRRPTWIVDFSYPKETMLEIERDAPRLVWLDHHKTAKEYADEIRGPRTQQVFDMKRCGSRILFDFLEPEVTQEAKWLVDYIQDRDLWKLELPDTQAVSAWIAAQPMTFKAWDSLIEHGLESAIISGESVQMYIDQYGRKARQQIRWELISGYAVPTINLPYMNCSEHVGKLVEENDSAPFAAGYFRRADGRWQFSLRAKNFDVSEIAKKFGGGGHAGAAGFDVECLPWEL